MTATESTEPPVGLSQRDSSFGSFYDRQYKQLVGLAYVMTGNWSEAEDLTQDAMIEAHRRWDKVRHYDNLEAWVRRVLVNKHRSKLRRLSIETRTLLGLAHETSHQPAPEIDQVFSLVRQLPDRQAKAVALRYWDDLSVGQIAEVLDCGQETVKTHLKRGRARLHDLLANQDHPMAVRSADDLLAARSAGVANDMDDATADAHRRNDHQSADHRSADKAPSQLGRVAVIIGLIGLAVGAIQFFTQTQNGTTEVVDESPVQDDELNEADDEQGLEEGELVLRSGSDSALSPLNVGGSIWNADGSRLLLYRQGGVHVVADAASGEQQIELSISPLDIEYVYWHPTQTNQIISVETDGIVIHDVDSDRPVTNIVVPGCDELLDPVAQRILSGELLGFKCASGDDVRIGLINLNNGQVVAATDGSGSVTAPVMSVSGDRIAVEDYEADRAFVYDADFAPIFDVAWDQPIAMTAVQGRDYLVGARYKGELTGSLVAVDLVDGNEWLIVGPTNGDDSPNPGIRTTATDDGMVALGVGKPNDPASNSRYEGVFTAGHLNVVDLAALEFDRSDFAALEVDPMVLAPLGITPDADPDYWSGWHISFDRTTTRIAFGSTDSGGTHTQVLPVNR